VHLAFVHLGKEKYAGPFLDRYALADVPRVSDPGGDHYEAFGLRRGGARELVGWKPVLRFVEAGLLHGHGMGFPVGDSRRMPGVFLLHRGRVLRSFRHTRPSDRPDYLALASRV